MNTMNPSHPINPPSSVIINEWIIDNGLNVSILDASAIASLASRLGADQELEACCEYIAGPGKWFANPQFRLDELRAARRPKPPSLKKQAYDALDAYIYGNPNHKDKEQTYNTIRPALEALDD